MSLSQFVLRREKACLFPTKNDNLSYTLFYNTQLELVNKNFLWLDSQNNLPDIMIKRGDAIEVKKTQSANSDLALNSSYPKSNISSSSPMITQSCKNCEEWTEKDLIYCLGHTTDTTLKSLWMVYGTVYAANHETYQRIKKPFQQE